MFLNPAAFNAHLNHMGQKVTWAKAFRCPCFNPHSGAARANCPNCHGKAWFWADPVTAVTGVASQQLQLKWAQFGMWQDGDTVLSVPEDSPVYESGQFDRIVMLNNTDYFSLPLVRGGPDERISDPVEKITRVFWLDGLGKLVEGGIPEVNADGTLTWTSGSPPVGMPYSITGTKYNEYYVYGAYPGDRMEHQGARLPRRIVVRRFDLFGRDL